MLDSNTPRAESTGSSARDHKLALLQAVFDEIPDVVVLKDDKGDFLLCNQTVARLYNTTPEAMVGKHDDDFGLPKPLAQAFRANVLDIMARGEAEVVFEDSRDAITGELRHFKSIKKPFKDANGRNQILVIAHDITDVVRAQQKIAQSEQRLREVMAATQEGIWDWHVQSGTVIHNARWYALLGFSKGDIADNVEAFSARIHPDDKPAVWEQLQQLLDGTVADYCSEHRMLRKDGTVVWVLDRGRVAERDAQGRPLRVVGAYADITGRMQDQAALEQALCLAQSATRAKSDFLTTMSHELRTPLNGILGMAQLLQLPDVSGEERRDYANIVVSSGHNLLSLLNDILDLAKVEAGRLDLEPSTFNLPDLLRDAAAVFETQASSKGLSLQINSAALPNQTYWGDPNRLRQMMANYLGNAIKFSDRGQVRLEVAHCSQDGDRCVLEFSVVDCGIGIDADKHALLFKPFTQADSSTTRKFGGTGLGLSIVARLAEVMGGTVGFDSETGVGSRFWFRVTLKAMPDAAARPVANANMPESNQEDSGSALSGHVLAAEDNAVNRMVIGSLLAQLGLQADFVENGRDAVDAIKRHAGYELVLMDIQMPVMDGLTASRCIRDWEAQTGAQRCPIVALTASAFEDDKQRCADAGMDDFLGKPVDLAQLAQTLARWLPRQPKSAEQG